MQLSEFIELIEKIVEEASALKNKHTNEQDALVNYACIFCQSEEEYTTFHNLATQLGEITKNTPTGPLFLFEGIETDSGKLRLLKIRKPDPTRTERGDADFTVENYDSFKETMLQKGCKLIERKDLEMIELTDDNFNVRAYFSNPPLDKILKI